MVSRELSRAVANGKPDDRVSHLIALLGGPMPGFAAAFQVRLMQEARWLVACLDYAAVGGWRHGQIPDRLANRSCLALGFNWIGRDVASGQALFISAEDDQDELHRRLYDVIEAEGVSFADLDRLTLRSLAGEDALLTALEARTDIQKATALFREIDAFLGELRSAVVELDPLADLFPGNENDRGQARQFIVRLRGFPARWSIPVSWRRIFCGSSQTRPDTSMPSGGGDHIINAH